jgi:ring-1,2-phenylacetyl-CoA epoxidase subunit PaaD
MVTRDAVWQALGEVEDPELPIAITELGLVRSIAVDGGTVRVRLIPTFVGCPALDVIRERVRERLRGLAGVRAVDVDYTFDEPWTIERMSAAGRARLIAHGLSVPGARPGEPARCPFCGSGEIVLENAFGPTPCRAVFYCRACRNPIERFKPPADALPGPGALNGA